MQLYGLKTCDTCRKALKSLRDATLVDVRETGMPEAVMARAFAAFGGDLVNTRSTTWRSLGEADRARPPLELLADHPALMKRPLIDADGALYLGWGPDTRRALGVA